MSQWSTMKSSAGLEASLSETPHGARICLSCPPSAAVGLPGPCVYRMLRDDRAASAKTAVLLASHTGARLYPVVGYKQIGTLLVFTPKKR